MEDPVYAILVIGSCEHVRYQELSTPGDNDRVIPEIGMFEEDSSVFFMDANGVFDGLAGPCTVYKGGVHVVYCPLAIAPKSEAVGHVATSVFAQVESMLPLMWMLGITIRDHHLGQRQSVEYASFITFVIIGNVVQDNTFPIVETNMDFPILPFNHSIVHLERDTFRLSDVDRLYIFSVPSVCFDGRRMIIISGCLIQRSPNRRDINMNNLLSICVEDRGEIQRKSVLAVIHMRTIVHQSLLQTDLIAESLIETNRPGCAYQPKSRCLRVKALTVTIDLEHVFLGNTNNAALFNDLWILSNHMLNNLKILHGNLSLLQQTNPRTFWLSATPLPAAGRPQSAPT